MKFIPFTVFLIITIAGCSPGYRLENGRMAFVYYDEGAGKNIDYIDADQSTFNELENPEYGRDRYHVFYRGGVLNMADPSTFELLHNDGYSKDKNRVYFRSQVVIDADPGTFRVIRFPYSRDSSRIFCGTVPMRVALPDMFKVTESSETIIIESAEFFLKRNPDFNFIDPHKYPRVVYGRGRAVSGNEKFTDYKTD